MAALAVAAPARSATSPPSPICVPRATPAAAGLTVTSATPVKNHPHVTDVTFTSRALNGTVHADVLLPASYDPHGPRRYPVLYLLHGHGGSHADWTNHDVDRVIGDLPVIVVMPDGGYDGFYSDWYGTDVDGHTPAPAPGWETFHIRELLPWVDATFKTIADRRGRAVAGLSMGGFGAMSYAARHPDLFVAAGSFSGAVDTDLDYPVGGTGMVGVANLPDRKQPDGCIWGDPLTQDVVWRDHNPTELARNLSGLSLYLAAGNGQPGRHDDPSSPSPSGAATEFGIFFMTTSFDKALTDAHIAHTTNLYGAGTHSWPYWLDDLREFLPRMQSAFAAPPAAPPAVGFAYESAASPFSVWGWSFTPHRDAAEMTYLHDVTARGLSVTGSGVLSVVTPPLYRRGRFYAVRGAQAHYVFVRADGRGRLHFNVDLGPSHATQQYQFGPTAESSFPHATVTISPVQ
jgi:S-formylglutathione hydrolase FrmB